MEEIQERVDELLYNNRQQNLSDESKFCHKFNKIYLEFSASLCHVDLLASDNSNAKRCAQSQTITKSSEWRQRARKKLWPYLVTLVWFACNLNLLHYLYHQYTYDIYSLKLSRLHWLKQTQTREVSEDYLIRQLEERGRYLKSIGAPFMHLSFEVESVYLAIVLASFITYILAGAYFTWKSPFSFYFIQNIFSIDHEQRRGEQFVHLQVEKFINSSENFSRNHRLLQSSNTWDIQIVSATLECLNIERLSCSQLYEMLHSGQLRPLNQRADGVNKQSIYYALVVLVCSLYTICFNIIITCMMYNYLDKPMSELQLSDWLIHCELMVLLFVCEISAVFYSTAGVFTCLDQAFMVNKLRKLLSLIVHLNNLRFFKFKLNTYSRRAHQDDTMRKDQLMNGDILLVLMHYRIYVAQFLKLRLSLSIIATAMVLLMFVMPIVGRLHVPYFGPNSMRQLVVVICCLVILPLDVCLVPVCYLNKRSLDLYRDLNYLLAHAIEVSNYREARQIYDLHIVAILRKELSHPDEALRQLSIRSSSLLNITYENLVRIHFYAGFIILTLLGDDVAYQKEAKGTIFTDPFGLF